jgi:hypothetical protein
MLRQEKGVTGICKVSELKQLLRQDGCWAELCGIVANCFSLSSRIVIV